MSKQIKDENGKVYVQKKPFYKRAWFWGLVIVLIIGFSSALNGGTEKTESATSTDSHKVTKASSSKEQEKPKVPAQHAAALTKAKSYAKNLHMSEKSIYEQLTSESGEAFSQPAAKYAMDNLSGIDWKENALKKAQSYQKNMAMSTNAIKEQLTSEAGEGFTNEQAQYAIDHLNK